MSINEENIKLAIENRHRQLLYSIIDNSMTGETKEADEQLKEKIKNFKENVTLLSDLISDNGIPGRNLTQYLVLLIHETLSAKDQTELVTLKISDLNKKTDDIVKTLSTLHKLCQEKIFRTALCKIQTRFATACEFNAEAPSRNLRGELLLWQSRLPKDKGDAGFVEANHNIEKIQAALKVWDKSYEDTKKFCEQYTVRY